MRSNIPSTTNETVRTVAGKIRVGADHPIFNEFPAQETPAGLLESFTHLTQAQNTALGEGDWISQYGLAGTTIYRADVRLDAATIDRNFSTYFNVPAGTLYSETGEYYGLSALGTSLWCMAEDNLYKKNATGWTLWGSLEVYGGSLGEPMVNIAAVDENTVVAAMVYAGSSVTDHCRIVAATWNGTSLTKDVWKGSLPRHASAPNIAAVRDGETIHIYVDDWSGKKPVHLQCFAPGTWSAASEILPMDALDEDSTFTVGCASRLDIAPDYPIFLTGVLKRRYGPSYSIYMRGPGKFTFGRDLIIKNDSGRAAQFFLSTDQSTIYAACREFHSCSADVSIFKNEFDLHDIDIFNFDAQFAVNQPGRLSFELAPSDAYLLPNDLVPGARADLVAEVNGTEYTVGRFGIDRIREMLTAEGKSYNVECSSINLKRMMDWESDTYFDYLGQGEVHGNPGDLTKLIRVDGSQWSTDTGLAMEALNENGLLYTTPPASHGGYIRARFENVQTANCYFGLGLNYSEETVAEAAERLGKKMEEVKAGERARRALLLVCSPGAYFDTSNVTLSLFDWNTVRSVSSLSPYRLIQSQSIPVNGSSIWHLALQFQDGYARAYYQNIDAEVLYLAFGVETLLPQDDYPVEHENYGRGVLFFRNETGYHMSYQFNTESDVIPLYDNADAFAKHGWPLYADDNDPKFPATNGTVLVDSEHIQYTGLKGWGTGTLVSTNRRTEDLWLVPGRVTSKTVNEPLPNPPSGTDIAFASSRANNYLLQEFVPEAGKRITGVRLWLKKVNFPEDGVMVTINVGTTGTQASEVALVNNSKGGGVVEAEKIPEGGGWVTFYFNGAPIVPEAGKRYFIMLRRAKNWTHPEDSAKTYYTTKNMGAVLSGKNAWTFSEDSDRLTAVAGSGSIPFQVYSAFEAGISIGFGVGVKWEANHGLPTSGTNYFQNQALVTTQGSGKNTCFRIGRDYHLQDSTGRYWVFFLDRNPGAIFDDTTQVRAVPAFYGLKRGQSGTFAAAHGNYSQVHMPISAYVRSTSFEYYTAEEDLALSEVAEAIARKSGVTQFVSEPTASTGRVKNWIDLIQLPAMEPGDYVDISYMDESTGNLVVSLGMSMEGMGGVTVTYQDGPTTEYFLNMDIDGGAGDFRISVYDGHLSLWLGGRILAGAQLGARAVPYGPGAFWQSYDDPTKTAVHTRLTPNTRIDYFTMDMGRGGLRLLEQLIGDRRVYFRDRSDGKLELYYDRDDGSITYDRAVDQGKEITDIGLATRVLLEGGEVVEVSSAGNLRKYGNFFRTFNFSAINNLDDAAYFADLILEDMSFNRERVEISGAVDLRVEPTDIITLAPPLGQSTSRRIVVDAVAHQMNVDESAASYDMHISGRFMEAE